MVLLLLITLAPLTHSSLFLHTGNGEPAVQSTDPQGSTTQGTTTANGATTDCCKQQGDSCPASYPTDPNVDTMISGMMYSVCCLENTNYDGASDLTLMPVCTSAEAEGTTPDSAATKDVTKKAAIGLALIVAAFHAV